MATLTLLIKEDLIIGGKQQGTSTTKEVTGVNNSYCRYYVVDSTEDTIIDFQADRSSGGAVEDGTVKYARFTHTGSSNTVDLRFQATAANKEFLIRLSAGESHLLFFDQIDAESQSSGLGGNFSGSQLDVIKAICSAGDGATLEVLIAQS
tara:strand:+ start:2096 stop:2545 length:450 start_codon:yes stop_codon:yes gene_type:complete